MELEECYYYFSIVLNRQMTDNAPGDLCGLGLEFEWEYFFLPKNKRVRLDLPAKTSKEQK
jgi:hypothetical protein